MKRPELWHAIRTACQIMRDHGADTDSVIIVGSQSILGTYTTSALPNVATMSAEVDALPNFADPRVVEEFANFIEGICGEMSPFAETHGFAIDGVDLETCILPAGWRTRLVPVANASTMSSTGTQFTGLCLDPADLCVAKLCAGRPKDREFVFALLEAELVDAEVVRLRLSTVEPRHLAQARAALDEFFPDHHHELQGR